MLVKNAKFVFDPLDGKVKDCARKSKSLHISHALSYFINLNLRFEIWASFGPAGQFRVYFYCIIFTTASSRIYLIWIKKANMIS